MGDERRGSRVMELFLVFLKIGAFTFGGGYAMIPLIQKEVVEKRHWIEDGDILDIVAIAESTPGPIAVNAATFVGSKIGGFWGSFAATFGVVLPSFLIIYGVSFVLRQFEDLQVVRYAFNGVRAGVLALMVKALITMYRQCPKSPVSYAIMGLALAAVAFFGVDVMIVIIVCAAIGLATSLMAARRSAA